MIIRNIVRQLETPDRLRGRMTGVNMVFFMGGPQLGELEAGAVANWLGASISVISGGVGCRDCGRRRSPRRRRRCGSYRREPPHCRASRDCGRRCVGATPAKAGR